ncbi:MAG TPA: HDIG domain-containing protein [Gemmatimonadaceae bacterium]|nr:HDIG domain-containing protein [Gemmatimonadaceae bacterium]
MATNTGGRRQVERALSPAPPDGYRSRVAYHGARIALLVVLAMLTYVLFPASPAVDSPIFEVGSVATQTVIAPFAFTVPKSAAALAKEQDELAQSAKPIFVYLPAALDSAQRQLATFMDSVRAAVAGAPDAKQRVPAVIGVAAALGVSLTDSEAQYLTFSARRRAMHDALRRVLARWLSAGVALGAAIDDVRGEVIIRRGSEERGMLADSVLTFGSLLARSQPMQPDRNSSVADGIYLKLLSAFFHPTIALDRHATDQRRQELRNTVDPNLFQVRAGEKIVGEHEVVARAAYEKMRALHNAMQARTAGQGGHPIGRILGAIAYNALVLAIFGIAVVVFRPQLYTSYRSMALFALVFLLVLAGASAAAHAPTVYPEFVPVVLAAIILSILFDSRISMIAAMILAVLVGGQSVFRGTNALFMNLIGGATAALSVRMVRRRDQAYYSIVLVAFAYFAAAIAIGLTLGWQSQEIGWSAARGGMNAIVSVVFAMFLLPLAEKLTGVTTDLTLLEYSDLNRPLLRRLSLEAPGTYNHTISMANLVEVACTAIGANGLLGRVGTYYHDIGKLKKPQYFVENQQGRNPHDKLKPSTSAAIIRNHVREGMELAEESHLPRSISTFIPQHHGTSQISFFLEKARERDGTGLNIADFTYPGPIPQSAETAICMLADGVEASARVLQEPTPEKIRELIEHIVRQRIEQGQMRDAPLTLKQLDVVKEQFARVLIGQYHNRTDYPAASGGVTSEFASV